jgi:hypothetical protein
MTLEEFLDILGEMKMDDDTPLVCLKKINMGDSYLKFDLERVELAQVNGKQQVLIFLGDFHG